MSTCYVWVVGGLVSFPVTSVPPAFRIPDVGQLGSERPCSSPKDAEWLGSGNVSILPFSLSTPTSATYWHRAIRKPSTTQLRPWSCLPYFPC